MDFLIVIWFEWGKSSVKANVDKMMKMEIGQQLRVQLTNSTHTHGIMHITLSLSLYHILHMYRSNTKRDTTRRNKDGNGYLPVIKHGNGKWTIYH